MSIPRLVGFVFVLGLSSLALAAESDNHPETGERAAHSAAYSIFPPSDDLFERLLADPRQAQTSLRYYRSEGADLADVALGNTWGLARWNDVRASGWDVQTNVEGMAYSRFRLSGSVNEFQTVDFFANIPVTVRKGPYSGRLTLFHESSHLGDDYIRRTNDKGFRYSVEGLRIVGSMDATQYVRLYAGGTVLLHQIPKAQDGALEMGFELKTKEFHWSKGRSQWFYFAEDFSPQGRAKWNPDFNTEVGFRMGVPHVVRALRVHLGYYEGHSQFGQFFSRREHYFSLGASFDF